jgi:dTDP-4-dehydrorhamnose 3,5-epimerase
VIFHEQAIEGVVMIDLEHHEDERGFFARTYCVEEFGRCGLNTDWPQCNMSHSDRKGTLRGIHYQAPPEPDAKLIRVTQGSIFGVALDLRPDSRTFGRSVTCTLSYAGGTMLYVPAGCGFGFQTMEDDTELSYQMSVCYRPDLARGVRWNDPTLGIRWPRDAAFPELRDISPVLST